MNINEEELVILLRYGLYDGIMYSFSDIVNYLIIVGKRYAVFVGERILS